jgi:hypothetical protein
MAQEIVHWCDWHIADENTTRVLATAMHTLVIDGVESALELCDECDVKRWQPLAEFVAGFAVKVPTPAELARERKREKDRERARRKDANGERPGGDSTTCPRCDREFTTRHGLGVHGWRTHGLNDLVNLFDKSLPDGADLKGDK